MKKLTALLLSLTLLLFLCACAESRTDNTVPTDGLGVGETTEPTTEATTEPSEDTASDGDLNDENMVYRNIVMPTEIPDVFYIDEPLAEYVTDARSEEVIFGQNEYVFSYPQVLLDSEDAESWNEELTAELNPMMDSAVAGSGMYTNFMEYDAWLYENALSVVVKTNVFDTSLDVYDVAVFDVETGKRMDNAQIAALVGRSSEGLQEEILTTMTAYFEEMNGESSEDAFYQEQREATFSQENLEQTRVFLKKDGELMLLCRIYTMAGAGEVWRILSVDDTLTAPYVATVRTEYFSEETGYGARLFMSYSYPEVLLDSEDARAWNAELAEELEPIFNQAMVEDPEERMYEYASIFYDAWVWDNTLTVVVTLLTHHEHQYLSRIAVFDLTTGQRLDNMQIAALAGVAEDNYDETLRQALGAAYEESVSDYQEDSLTVLQREKTGADENLDRTLLYIGRDGTLMAAGYIYCIAGPDCWWITIPVEVF